MRMACDGHHVVSKSLIGVLARLIRRPACRNPGLFAPPSPLAGTVATRMLDENLPHQLRSNGQEMLATGE